MKKTIICALAVLPFLSGCSRISVDYRECEDGYTREDDFLEYSYDKLFRILTINVGVFVCNCADDYKLDVRVEGNRIILDPQYVSNDENILCECECGHSMEVRIKDVPDTTMILQLYNAWEIDLKKEPTKRVTFPYDWF